jgi:hypothetical protein
MQDETYSEVPVSDEHDSQEDVAPQVVLSRRKRGVAPIVGMQCPAGYALVGEECVMTNVEFE